MSDLDGRRRHGSAKFHEHGLCVEKFGDLGDRDAEVRARLALATYLTGDKPLAIEQSRLALEYNPKCADAHGVHGAALIFSGQCEAGRAAIAEFLVRSPRDPAALIRLAMSCIAIRRCPIAEASHTFATLKAKFPQTIDPYIAQRALQFSDADDEHLLEGLGKAGWRPQP